MGFCDPSCSVLKKKKSDEIFFDLRFVILDGIEKLGDDVCVCVWREYYITGGRIMCFSRASRDVCVIIVKINEGRRNFYERR